MKKIILAIVCLIFIVIHKSYASNDSLVIINDTLRETNIKTEEGEILVNEEKKIAVIAPTIIERKVNIKQSKLKNRKPLSKPHGFGDFIGGLMDMVSQLWKPVWGYYEEDNMRKEGPYFLFMNTDNGNAFIKKQMADLRIKIQVDKSSEFKIYKTIFNYAGTTTIENCNGTLIPNWDDGTNVCPSVARAKASAFVYLVGLDGSGNQLDGTDKHGPIRKGYRDRVEEYLRFVKTSGLNNFLDYTGIAGANNFSVSLSQYILVAICS